MQTRARNERRSLAVLLALSALIVLALAWTVSNVGTTTAAVTGEASGALAARERSPETKRDDTRVPLSDVGEKSARVPLPIEGQLSVRVFYTDGSPAPGARVLLHDSRLALTDARADESGRATLRCSQAVRDRELWIAVAGAGLGVHDEPLAVDAELAAEVAIQLPYTGRIAGRVTVEGRPPSEDLELALFDSETRPVTLPEAVWIELRGGEEPTVASQTARVSRDDGAFVFRGIPESAAARIRLPTNHSASTDSVPCNSVTIGGPAEDLALDLIPYRRVRGRVVHGDGSPAERARVHFESDVLGELRTVGAIDSDDLGRFELRAPPSWTDLSVEARSSDLREAAEANFVGTFPPPSDGTNDVGDVVLERCVVHVLRVRERGGAPIEGARVSWSDDAHVVRTASDGTAQVFVLHGERTRTVFVRAQGFHPATARTECRDLCCGTTSIDDEARSFASTLEVELDRATELVVAARAADGSRLGGMGFGVELVPRAPLFDRHRDSYGGHPPPGVRTRRRANRLDCYWFRLDVNGEARVVGVVEGIPLVLRLVDPTGFVVAEQSVSATTASMRFEFVAEHAPRALFGRVLDRSGEPLRAHVIADGGDDPSGNGPWSARLLTDRQGRFRVETCAPWVRLSIAANDCSERLPSVDPANSPFEFRLSRE